MLEKVISRFAIACIIALFATFIASLTGESVQSVLVTLILSFFSIQIAKKVNSLLSSKHFLIGVVCVSFALNIIVYPCLIYFWNKSYVIVPDLTGKSVSEAVSELDSCGLAYIENIQGNEIIMSQNPRGEIKVAPGTVVQFSFAENVSENSNLVEAPEPTASLSVDFMSVRPGQTFMFGSYEQDENKKGEEPIEWIVLKVEDGRMLVVSKFGLDAQPFNLSGGNASWDSSSIRTWLEDEFYYYAFSEKEKEQILLTDNYEADDTDARSYQGRDTSDHVFLLSITEVNELINSNPSLSPDDILCEPSQYADDKVEKVNNPQYCWWWLRTTVNKGKNAYSVNCDGTINYGTREVSWKQGAVRPAMWIILN